MSHSPQKLHMHPCMRAYATVQKPLCHGNYCELSWDFCKPRAGCCLPHALLLSRRNQSPDAARPKKMSKSTLAHDAVATVVSHTHHSIIRVGAGHTIHMCIYMLAGRMRSETNCFFSSTRFSFRKSKVKDVSVWWWVLLLPLLGHSWRHNVVTAFGTLLSFLTFI